MKRKRLPLFLIYIIVIVAVVALVCLAGFMLNRQTGPENELPIHTIRPVSQLGVPAGRAKCSPNRLLPRDDLAFCAEI